MEEDDLLFLVLSFRHGFDPLLVDFLSLTVGANHWARLLADKSPGMGLRKRRNHTGHGAGWEDIGVLPA